MRIRDVVNFQYIEAPEKQAIFKALGDLFLLSAINEDGEITEFGIEMSRFPLEPQFSKAALLSAIFGVEDSMLTLVSMLSSEGIWKKVLRINEEQYEKFINKQMLFLSKTGDHESLLNVYSEWMKCEQP